MEHMIDGSPHGTTPLPATQEEQGLCERCQALEIGTYLEKSGQVEVGRLAAITKSSLKSDCRFCQQFCKMFSTLNQSGSLAETSEMVLSRERLPSLGGYEDQKYYLNVLPDVEPAKVLDRHQILYFHPIPIGKCLTPNIANYVMVKQALLDCEENHLGDCQPLSTPSGILQLIDCKTGKINPAIEGQRYICLSYVWGPDGDGAQLVPLSLPIDVPKTIEDAIFVAIELGIPFLWVDRYCIDHTNRQKKHTIIRNMDKIYSGANLTIIAAAGVDPHHGLPGVRGTPRSSHFQLEGGFCTYIGTPLPKMEIKNSKWGSRGW
ncbi:hypothetical protein HBI44_148420 [Parastagonospora nodorum]|nr:hypothetical protein HBH42_093350 [Parastagonospora nodorum]KAH5426518.1 hypothetical protein HBI47_118100 [Parastagonospora nodorum]KAH5693355.1 hypothetical protein HBI44_148420 [Parastagonospora nodorum]